MEDVPTGPEAFGPSIVPAVSMINLSKVPKNAKGSMYSTVFGIIDQDMCKTFGLLGMRKEPPVLLVAFTVPESDKLFDLGRFFSNDGMVLLTLPSLPWDFASSYPEFCETLFGLVEAAVEGDEDNVDWDAVPFPNTMTEDLKRALKETINACVERKQRNANFIHPLYAIVAATKSVEKGSEQVFMYGEYAYTRPAVKNGPMETVRPKAHGYTLMSTQLER